MRWTILRWLLLYTLPGICRGWTLEHGARIAAAPLTRKFTEVEHRTSILSLPHAERWFTDNGLTERHLLNVYTHIFRRGGEWSADAIHIGAEMPRVLARKMCDDFDGITTSRVVERVPSDGGVKLVVELASGHRVETVLILHEHKSSGSSRCTVCVSSQVGCARGCSFCATGTMGLLSDLSSAEILEQVWHARREVLAGYEVRNVVFMGMGEPLDNFDALLAALRGLTHQAMFGLAAKHLTVSTVGARPAAIRRLADEAPTVRLALSLHSALAPLRAELIPSAASITDLASALDYHASATRCGLMVEYLLIDGVNDRPSDADALAAFCAERDAAASAGVTAAMQAGATPPLSRKQARAAAGYVNLIPFNPTEAGDRHGYATPSDATVERFHRRLREVHGVNALVRWTSAVGRDANGACGQLALEQPPAARRPRGR